MEHALVGKPQIVPDSSACSELYYDCGLLIPASLDYTYEHTLTTGKIVSPEDVAEQMEILYMDKDLYKKLSAAGEKKFSDDKYSWNTIAKQFEILFNESWES